MFKIWKVIFNEIKETFLVYIGEGFDDLPKSGLADGHLVILAMLETRESTQLRNLAGLG